MKVSALGQVITRFFTFWVLLVALVAYLFPTLFAWLAGGIPLLLGIIMFGMGLTLQLKDFQAVVSSPKSAIAGVVAQYTIMPLLAFAVSSALSLSKEAAIGVILVGCCPGGTASNVITWLARGNTALSVAITSVSTLLAPLLTPLLVLLLAGHWLDISVTQMMLSILQMVLLPVAGGIILRRYCGRQVDRVLPLLPSLSVVTIVVVVGAVVAINTDALAQTGWLILMAVMLHNLLGLLFGFLMARWLQLPYADQKALSIEVGMQNSGLGAALAVLYFSPVAAVPSAIFSVWHNISGPALATWWRRNSKDNSI